MLGVAMLLLLEAAAHHRNFSQPDLPVYPADIVECDVFNPIAAIFFCIEFYFPNYRN